MSPADVVFGTPRKLPNPARLRGRVVVLDIAFAGATPDGFEKITAKFLAQLGDRLALWVDHHDHDKHAEFRDDPRFLLATKAEHGACPEMITPELVQSAGQVDTIVCHSDFDGIASAAKWLLGGHEPYPGADADAYAIDTRLGTPSETGVYFDRALRARGNQDDFCRAVLELLTSRLEDKSARAIVDRAEQEFRAIELETLRAARSYKTYPRRGGGDVAYVDITSGFGRLDKTDLLLHGQKIAQMAVVVDAQNVALAAPFDSGVNFLELLGLSGGMPTRISVARKEHDAVMQRLGVDFVR
jgi:hypothetical protein